MGKDERNSSRAYPTRSFAGRSSALVAAAACVLVIGAIVLGLVTVLWGREVGGSSVQAGSNPGNAPAISATASGPSGQLGAPEAVDSGPSARQVQAFVAALTSYRGARGTDAVAARRYEAEARAHLTPRLNSSAPDLEALGVYADPGPGDEDGWPEPVRGEGDANRFVLTVAFDSDAGEAAHGAGDPGSQVSRLMEVQFARVDGRWEIDGIRRVTYNPYGDGRVHLGEGEAPAIEPTAIP